MRGHGGAQRWQAGEVERHVQHGDRGRRAGPVAGAAGRRCIRDNRHGARDTRRRGRLILVTDQVRSTPRAPERTLKFMTPPVMVNVWFCGCLVWFCTL